MIEFKNVTMDYLADALLLAKADYEEACLVCPALSKAKTDESLEGLLTPLFQNGLGKLALKDGKLIGYLAFFGPWQGFHGNVTGAFSPLGGSCFASKNLSGISKDKLSSMLVSAAAEDFVEKSILQMAISTYAYDNEVGRSLVLNGFGIRCSDAIMSLDAEHPLLSEAAQNLDASITVKEVPIGDRLLLLPLNRELIRHLAKAPALFPTYLSYDNVEGDLEDPDIRYFAAYKDHTLIGYMCVKSEGENFISNTSQTANICGAYVKEEYRSNKVAGVILSHICDAYRQKGYPLLGVDYETLNPTALRFWTKFFTPYTYSYIRRFDERIAGYEHYFNEYFKS